MEISSLVSSFFFSPQEATWAALTLREGGERRGGGLSLEASEQHLEHSSFPFPHFEAAINFWYPAGHGKSLRRRGRGWPSYVCLLGDQGKNLLQLLLERGRQAGRRGCGCVAEQGNLLQRITATPWKTKCPIPNQANYSMSTPPTSSITRNPREGSFR